MSIDDQVQRLVTNFVSEITRLARRAAVDTLTEALSPGNRTATPRPRQAQLARPAKAASPGRPKKGAKRPKADIAQLEALLAKHIQKHPGQRVEQINKVLGTKTNDVRLPLIKLIDAGTVKTKGERRATHYFPG